MARPAGRTVPQWDRHTGGAITSCLSPAVSEASNHNVHVDLRSASSPNISSAFNSASATTTESGGSPCTVDVHSSSPRTSITAFAASAPGHSPTTILPDRSTLTSTCAANVGREPTSAFAPTTPIGTSSAFTEYRATPHPAVAAVSEDNPLSRIQSANNSFADFQAAYAAAAGGFGSPESHLSKCK